MVGWSGVFGDYEWVLFGGWYKMMGGVDMRWVLWL